MKFEIIETDSTIKIILEGAIELQTIKEFRTYLDEMDFSEKRDIEIDLSGVGYIDSTGISILIMLYKKQKQDSRGFIVRNASHNVAGLLELSSLKDVMQ
ncbi:MAG TPA: STAS domain-containing protein [Spirochaetota bacterium]|nr:STAS domain-containing protein [Spirochaetota bacterium]HQP48440.1 STAS domain-containing protein [Spirochaetota bacterium]